MVQCYRGLELVSGDDKLIFNAGEGLDLKVSYHARFLSYLKLDSRRFGASLLC